MSFENYKKNELRVGIVGAGPAGAMAAYLLASKGHHVTLLERKKETERKVCGEYLCPKGVKLLEDLNLLDILCGSFKSLSGMVLVSPEGDIVPSYFPQTGHQKLARGLSLNRKIFDQNLLNLATLAGANLLMDKTIIQAINQNDKWLISTEKETFSFDLLIVADGRQSKIGNLLGHLEAIETKRAAIHCYLPRKIDRGQRLGEMHILDGSQYCGLDPITDDEVNFSIVCDSKRLKVESPEQIINHAIAGSKRLSHMFDLIDDSKVEIKVVSSLRNKNNFIAGNQLAYVGDAAGFIDPLTGEGIYNALFSSYLLVQSLERKNLNTGLWVYKSKKKFNGLQKNVLNHFFQFLIKRPRLANFVANYLKKSQKRANEFIGIIGNINTPIKGIINMLRA